MQNHSQKALSIIFAGLFLCLTSCSDNATESNVDAKTLKRGNGPEPESLDPQLVRSESAGNIVRDLYEGLLTEAGDGSLVSGVAETWTYDPESMCYLFTLKKDAKWSNGDHVISQDFQRGLEFAMLASSNSPSRELLDPLKNVHTVNSHQLELCLEYPVAYFTEVLALPIGFPRHALANQGGRGERQYISNGAYSLKKWTPQDQVILIKNPHFHSSDSVYFEQVNYVTTENAASELKRFLAGELDLTATVPPSDVKRLKKDYASSIKIAPVLNTYFYGFNNAKAPFKDSTDLRKALSLVVDRDILVDRIIGTGEQAAYSLVPPGINSYQSPELAYQAWPMSKRIQEAQRLYAQAGYSTTNPLKFELRYNTSPLHKKIAVSLASMWKQALGVEVSLYNEEWKVFVQNRRKGNTQMFRSGWIADVNDASNYLELLASSHSLNDYAYHDKGYDQFLDLAKTATSKRASLLRAAEEKMLEDQAIIPLYYYVSKHMLKPEVQGWQDNALDHHLSRYLFMSTIKE